MYIIGISAFYHDNAACLLKNVEIVAAAQEERFTRKKHITGFPSNTIQYCIEKAGITANKIDNIVFYEKPFMKFERLLEISLAFALKDEFRYFMVTERDVITLGGCVLYKEQQDKALKESYKEHYELD